MCMLLYFGDFPTWPFYWDIFQHLTWGKIQLYKFSMIHSAFEGRLRGFVISNFHDVAGFYMLVGGFSEGIGPQLP